MTLRPRVQYIARNLAGLSVFLLSLVQQEDARAQSPDHRSQCAKDHPDKNQIQWWTAPPSGYEDCLWSHTFEQYLDDPLWEKRDMYDAGHQLYLPILSAFYFSKLDWGRKLYDHYSAYESLKVPPLEQGALTRLQYEYTLSEWLASSAEFQKPEWDLPILASRLVDTTIELWLTAPAWQWQREPFEGMKKRVEWKLAQGATKPSFLRASIDAEWFLFGTAANLVRYLRAKGKSVPPTLNDVLVSAQRVFVQGVESNETFPWRFQVGTWTDSNSHAYAGHLDIFPGIEKKKRPNVVMDSSHATRTGALFRSLLLATKGTEAHSFWEDQIEALTNQLNKHVFVPPDDSFPSWRSTNYMDGYNGLYRWNYSQKMENKGYRPYQLSGTLLFGWWSALGPKTAHLYVGLSQAFPLAENVQETYVGPNTWRERHPMVTIPMQYNNGAAELKTRLASRLAFRVLQSPFPSQCENMYPFAPRLSSSIVDQESPCPQQRSSVLANFRAWLATWIQAAIIQKRQE